MSSPDPALTPRRTLVYKRTHPGDPDRQGRFGIYGCMGRVRTWPFDAVIGVGGIGSQPKKHGLACKVNWIGIGPRRSTAVDKHGLAIITFDHFRLFGTDGSDGPSFRHLAPKLADRMYSRNVRVIMNSLKPGERREVEKILALAENSPPSSAGGAGRMTAPKGCLPRTPPAKTITRCSS